MINDLVMMLPREITAADFIEHTAPAVMALFNAIASERERYEPIKRKFQGAYEMHYVDFITSDLQEDFDDHQVQHKFARSAEAKMQAFLVSQSIEVLYGAILQIGKQGISLVLTKDDRFSKGKLIGSQYLSSIVWHGRNQAMHWEEGIPTNKLTRNCFETLEQEIGPQFSMGESPRNMAWDVINAVGWATYDDYVRDIREVLES